MVQQDASLSTGHGSAIIIVLGSPGQARIQTVQRSQLPEPPPGRKMQQLGSSCQDHHDLAIQYGI
jgi:hypothetical protein